MKIWNKEGDDDFCQTDLYLTTENPGYGPVVTVIKVAYQSIMYPWNNRTLLGVEQGLKYS